MLSETDRDSLSDILINIDLAISFAQGFDYERFLADMRTFYAITRCLEIISEASRRLSPETKARHPDIPWRKVSGSGNIYRHDYEDVAHRLVWGTVHEFLPALRAMAKTELAQQAWPASTLTRLSGGETCNRGTCFPACSAYFAAH